MKMGVWAAWVRIMALLPTRLLTPGAELLPAPLATSTQSE